MNVGPGGSDVLGQTALPVGHDANIPNPRYRLMGIGALQDTAGSWYVAQVFGRS